MALWKLQLFWWKPVDVELVQWNKRTGEEIVRARSCKSHVTRYLHAPEGCNSGERNKCTGKHDGVQIK